MKINLKVNKTNKNNNKNLIVIRANQYQLLRNYNKLQAVKVTNQ